jgi:hypothetical protein
MTSSTIQDVGIYSLVGYAVLTIFTAIYFYHHFVWVPRVKRELFELNKRRAGRIREALATGQNLNIAVSPAATFPFVAWVDLCPDGTVATAGRTFSTDEAFQISARDERHILRALATCEGNGNVVIASHGQTFVARFENGRWDVQSSSLPIG